MKNRIPRMLSIVLVLLCGLSALAFGGQDWNRDRDSQRRDHDRRYQNYGSYQNNGYYRRHRHHRERSSILGFRVIRPTRY
jgi:hypothetical protein